jgi:hypothetical protein
MMMLRCNGNGVVPWTPPTDGGGGTSIHIWSTSKRESEELLNFQNGKKIR